MSSPVVRDPRRGDSAPDGRAVAADDLDALADRLEAHWVHLARTPGLLADLLSRLNRDHFEARPVLRLLRDRGRAPIPRPAEPVPDAITEVERMIELMPGDERRISIQHALLLALKDHSQYQRAQDQAAAIRSLGEQLILNPAADFRLLGRASLHNGVINLLAGDLIEAGADLHAVTYLPETYPVDLAGAAGELALLHAVHGEHATAERWADYTESVADGWAEDWLNPGPHVAQLTAELILATDRLDWPRYEQVLGRLHTGRFVHDEHLHLAQYAQARAGLVRGQQRHLLDQITQLRRTWPKPVPEGSLPQTLLAGVEVQLALSVDDYNRARTLITQRPEDHHQALRLAGWQLATGRAGDAVGLLTKGPWLEQAPRRGVIDLCLALATALYRTGEREQSARYVLRALTQSGEPATMSHSLAGTDQSTLINATRYETAVEVALNELRRVLFITPAADTGETRTAALTPREQLILARLAEGGTAADIARTLVVSVHTVRNQIQRIYRKLHATSRRHAIDIATRRGLLPTVEASGDAGPDDQRA
ncbi:MAG TPA: LuxR C-terminal-related transcriptional regulator [Microlunatus sp.]|nr:LuxR C-terminal-related transcriptional regulator [Microlunatus sp.]